MDRLRVSRGPNARRVAELAGRSLFERQLATSGPRPVGGRAAGALPF